MASFKSDRQYTLVPTLYEIAGLSVLSIAILGILTIAPIIRNVNASTYHFFSEDIAGQIDKWLDQFNTTRITAILTFVLWCVVGALVYVLVWAIASLYKSYKDDVRPFSGLIVPDDAKVARLSLATHITRAYIRTVALLGLIFWTVFFFSKVLPYCVDQFVTNLINIDALSIAAILLSIVYMAASLFVFVAALRLVLLRRRIFTPS